VDRIKTYAQLAAELNQWRALPRHELMARLGSPPVVTETLIDDEVVSFEVRVGWADDRQTQLSVTAVAYGSSHWKLERMEEVAVLEAPDVGSS
jgi:hypothetical protein